MRNFITSKINKFFSGMVGFLIAVPLLIAGGVYAATVYPAGSLLQPNDVTSSHIRDNTIVNVDINTNAGIGIEKIKIANADGSIPFSGTGGTATTTDLTFSTSTRALTTGDLVVSQGTTTIRSVKYIWPATDGTANAALLTNGTGNLSWGTAGGTLQSATTTDTTISNSTTETTFFQYSVAANKLGTQNIIKCHIDFDTWALLNTNTMTFRLYYGASAVATTIVTATANFNTGIGFIETILQAANATNAQEAYVRYQMTGQNGSEGFTTTGGQRQTFGTGAIDDTAAQTLKITGQFSVASVSNTLTKKQAWCELLQV